MNRTLWTRSWSTTPRSRRDVPDAHLLRRAALSAEFALAQYLVKGMAAGNQDMIDEAESMLAALAEDVAEHGGQPISVEPLPQPPDRCPPGPAPGRRADPPRPRRRRPSSAGRGRPALQPAGAGSRWPAGRSGRTPVSRTAHGVPPGAAVPAAGARRSPRRGTRSRRTGRALAGAAVRLRQVPADPEVTPRRPVDRIQTAGAHWTPAAPPGLPARPEHSRRARDHPASGPAAPQSRDRHRSVAERHRPPRYRTGRSVIRLAASRRR